MATDMLMPEWTSLVQQFDVHAFKTGVLTQNIDSNTRRWPTLGAKAHLTPHHQALQ